jgi:oligosaccharide repeat unit polymerase
MASISAFFLVLMSFSFLLDIYRKRGGKEFGPVKLLCLLMFMIFIFRPLILLLDFDNPYPAYLYENVGEEVLNTQFVVVLYIFFLWFFFIFFNKNQPAIKFGNKLIPYFDGVLNSRRLILVSFALWAATGLIYLIYSNGYANLSEIIVAAKLEKELAGTFLFRQIVGLTAFLSVVGVCFYYYKNKILAVFFFLGFLFSSYVYSMWGTRETIALCALCLVIFLAQDRYTQKLDFKKFLLGAFSLLFVATVAYITRLDSIAGGDSWQDDKSLISVISVSFHMNRYDALMLLVRDWYDMEELRLGYDIVLGNLSAIPRFIWPSKPEVVLPGAWFRQIYEPYSINGWPFSVVGEWFISFWYMGLPIGAFITALIFSKLQFVYRNIKGQFNLFIMVFVTMTVVQNGSILQLLPKYILWVCPVIIIGNLIHIRKIT